MPYRQRVTNTSVYIASPEGLIGKSAVALGVIESLSRQVSSVGIFRPVVNGEHDEVTAALLAHTGIKQSYDDAIGLPIEVAMSDPESALSTIIEKYGSLRERYEAVVVIGSDYTDVASPNELAFNARLAANLNVPVLLVVGANDRTADEVLSSARHAIRAFNERHTQVLAVVATRVHADDLETINAALPSLDVSYTAALPESPLLAAPTVKAQIKRLGAKLWRGNGENTDRESLSILVAGMTLPNVLSRLEPECSVVLPSDRTDLLPGLILAHNSDTFCSLAAIYLVGGDPIPESIETLVDGIDLDIPIAVVSDDTYRAASALHDMRSSFLTTPRKNAEALRLFEEYIDETALWNALELPRQQLRTPRMFEYQIMQKARAHKKTIVLPEAEDARILEAASIILARGVADIVLLGEPDQVKADAARGGFDISAAKIQSMHDATLVEKFAATYAELRAKKGVTIEQAREKMTDPSYFGTMMVHLGLADGMVSGATHTTANTIRPALEFIKTKPGTKVVSGSFLMCMPDDVLVFADCAVNPNPSAEALADIAFSSAATARAFDIEPKVAMLSYSTGTSGSGQDVETVQQATDIINSRTPDFAIAGPIQFDAAIDPTVGKKKMPESDVAGQATVFIFPDLNTGNNTYKAVQRTAGAIAVGPVLQGLNKPVNDLSRGALVADIVNTVAITAIQAQTGI